MFHHRHIYIYIYRCASQLPCESIPTWQRFHLADKLITAREFNAHVRPARTKSGGARTVRAYYSDDEIPAPRTLRCPSRTCTKWSITLALNWRNITNNLITCRCDVRDSLCSVENFIYYNVSLMRSRWTKMNDRVLVIRKRAVLANESVMSNFYKIIYFYVHILL